MNVKWGGNKEEMSGWEMSVKWGENEWKIWMGNEYKTRGK